MTAKYKINEIEEMLSYARHIHVNSQDETDICKKCGHDLRHRIHRGIGDDKPVSDLFIEIAEQAVEDEVLRKDTGYLFTSWSEEVGRNILSRIKTLTGNE